MVKFITNSEELRDLIDSCNFIAVVIYGDGHEYDLPYKSMKQEMPGLEFALLHWQKRSIREEFRLEASLMTFFKDGKRLTATPPGPEAAKLVYDEVMNGEGL